MSNADCLAVVPVKAGITRKGIPLLTLPCPFWGFCEHVDRVLDNKKPWFYGDYRKSAYPVTNLKARLESKSKSSVGLSRALILG
jgi:hypothetical protein